MPSLEQFTEVKETVYRKVSEVNAAIRENETMQETLGRAKKTLEQILEKFPELPERAQFQKAIDALESLGKMEKLQYPRAVVRDTYEHVVALLDRLYNDVKPVISGKTQTVLVLLQEVKDGLAAKKHQMAEKRDQLVDVLVEKKERLVAKLGGSEIIEQIPSRVNSARTTIVSAAAEIDEKYSVTDRLQAAYLKIKETDDEKLNGAMMTKLVMPACELSEKYTPQTLKAQVDLVRSEWSALKQPAEEETTSGSDDVPAMLEQSSFVSVETA